MPIELAPGANRLLVAGGTVTVTVTWIRAPGELDVACFLLGDDGRVPSDDWMVFYNQPAAPGGVVRAFTAGQRVAFELDLDRLPAAITRLCFTATMEDGMVGAIDHLALSAGAGETAVQVLPPELGSERALILAELYRHASGWKMRAVMQGFDGGLAPLSRYFGVVVADPPAAPAPALPTCLGKVTLDKPAQSALINLGKKQDGTIEHVAVRLDWTDAIDLDLHAFYRLRSGAEGEVNFMEEGSLDSVPYIALDEDMGVDDEAGKNEENLTLSRLDTLDSVIFVANIFRDDDDDPESFAQYDGRVTVTTSLGEVVVPLTSTVPGNWAVIAKLENAAQGLRLVNINKVTRQQPMLADF